MDLDYTDQLNDIIANQLDILDFLEIMDIHIILLIGLLFFIIGWHELTRRS